MQLAGITDVTKAQHLQHGLYDSLWRNPATQPIYANDDPGFYYNPTLLYGKNTVAQTTESASGYTLNKNNLFQGGVSLTYDVPAIDGLKAKVFIIITIHG